MGAEHIRQHQFLPGKSGNPTGRPKKHAISAHLEHQLNQPIPESYLAQIPEEMRGMFGEAPTFGQFAAFKLITVAIGKGDVFAFKEILERVEGKVAQKSVHTGRMTLETLITGETLDEDE